MQQSYSNTQLPTTASQQTSGGGASWSNPNNILADDGSDATLGYFSGGDFGAAITGSDFEFPSLPDTAVIDGISLYIDGSQTGCYGTISIGITDSDTVDLGGLSGDYGGPTDLWGLDEITIADLEDIAVTVDTGDVSGGDGIASIDYMTVTIYYHIEVDNTDSDVPTRVDYKVFSRAGTFLGLLPNVTSDLAFPEDKNSAGTSIIISCGKKADNPTTVTPLLTEAGEEITTEDDETILTTSTDLQVVQGSSPDEAMFKNSNRVKAYLYNKYYPNGKLMFSGQINRVRFKYGSGDALVNLTVYSDGLDMNNFIARGYPFSYTNDVVQSSYNTSLLVSFDSSKLGGWYTLGQSWKTGAGVDTLGALTLKLKGTADVTIKVYDSPNGNLIGSTTRSVSSGSPTDFQFAFPELINVEPETEYFYAIWLPAGQSIRVYLYTPSIYSDGQAYSSTYSGGSGGGSFVIGNSDFYFYTKSGVPTTTATYTADDPVTDMASGILQDYNDRGGYITERDFEATGLSLSYTFVVSFIYDAIQKILELCPSGYYAYVDVGTAEIDIKQTSETADFLVTKGKHISELTIDMTIEQVKNYLLLTGGDAGGGTNLYRDYKDSVSTSNYGVRTTPKSDNRVTVTETADAIGDTFIAENSEEIQETTLTVLNEDIDITLLTPGKTVGFRNYGNFIDSLVLQIVRREANYSKGFATLILGRMPIRMTDEVQKINREVLNEQTIDNPTAPS